MALHTYHQRLPDIRHQDLISDSFPPATVYTIAQPVSGAYGDGSAERHVIVKEGPFGTGIFPPIFISRRDAIAYVNNNKDRIHDGRVVALRLVQDSGR